MHSSAWLGPSSDLFEPVQRAKEPCQNPESYLRFSTMQDIRLHAIDEPTECLRRKISGEVIQFWRLEQSTIPPLKSFRFILKEPRGTPCSPACSCSVRAPLTAGLVLGPDEDHAKDRIHVHMYGEWAEKCSFIQRADKVELQGERRLQSHPLVAHPCLRAHALCPTPSAQEQNAVTHSASRSDGFNSFDAAGAAGRRRRASIPAAREHGQHGARLNGNG